MSITDYPTLWWYPAPGQAGGKVGPDFAAAGSGGWSIDGAHQPDNLFIPWVLTGRRFYHDGIVAQAAQNEYEFNPPAAYRAGSAGHLIAYNTTSYQTQVRGQAWRMRQLVQAAAFAADSSRLKAHINTWVNTNLDALVAFLPALKTSEGELAVWVPGGYGTPGVFAPWQQIYFATSMAAAYVLGFPQGKVIIDAMMGFLAGCVLTPDFYGKDCCAYNLPVGANINAPTNTTWAQAKAALIAAGGSGNGTTWAPNSFQSYYASYYGVLRWAAAHGNAQAQQAINWLKANVSTSDVSVGATDAFAMTYPTFYIL